MLVRLFISNYKSFKDEVEFTMVSGPYKRHLNHLYDFENKLKILRVSAIYGNNGTGKTNFITSLLDLRKLVLHKSKLSVTSYIKPFKFNEDYLNKPTSFEIDFITQGKRYRYKISILNEIIVEEWLATVKAEKKLDLIFEREYSNGEIKLKYHYLKNSEYEKIIVDFFKQFLDKKMPFLTEGFNRQISGLEDAYNWFENCLSVIGIKSTSSGMPYFFDSDENFKNLANQIIVGSDLGIAKIELVKTPINDFLGSSETIRKKEIEVDLQKKDWIDFQGGDGKKYCAYYDSNKKLVISHIITLHNTENNNLVPLDLQEESAGTQKFFDILPAIVNTLLKNKVYIIDELETSFHPIFIKEVLRTYLQLNNQKSLGQIIFSTHECHFLDLEFLRQDEIWFVEKDNSESSKLTPLSAFKVRFDKDIRSSYLNGKYSKIPFLGNFDKIDITNFIKEDDD